MRVFTRATAIVAVILLAGSLRAAPYAHYSPDPSHILWFMGISDTHIGANGDRAVENMTWALTDAYDVIRPRLIINSGDLTDANSMLGIPWTQQEDEWRDYRAIIDNSGRTLDDLLDIPGNHDQYGDKTLSHYRQWSLWGRATDRTQHSVRVETDFGGVYHFLGVDTSGNDGAYPPADRAGLDAGELAYIQGSLDANADANMHLFFGHHPTGNLKYGESEFLGAMSVYEASTYIYGHTHDYSANYRDGTLHLNLDTLGKGDERNVGIGVIDQDLLSMRVFSAGIWPYVIISAPADAGLGGGNPHAYSVPPNWTEAPVRAVVFAPTDPEAVEFRVGDGSWTPMAAVRENVWQGTMDTTGMEPGRYNLTVRAHPWTKATDTISFRIGATACSNGLDDDFDGLTDWPEDPGCESLGTNDEEWLLPTVDPDPEPIPEVTESMPDAPFAEEAGPDAFAEEVGPDVFAEEVGPDDAAEPPTDEGASPPDVPTTVDPGATADARVSADANARPDAASQDAEVPIADAFVGDSASFNAGRSTGGCSTGGKPASGTWIWLLLPVALLVAGRRRTRPRGAR